MKNGQTGAALGGKKIDLTNLPDRAKCPPMSPVSKHASEKKQSATEATDKARKSALGGAVEMVKANSNILRKS